MKKIGIIDYGSGNIFSLAKAFQHLGCHVEIITSSDQLLLVDNLVLPGVGAFGKVMQKFEASGLKEVVCKDVKLGRPLLGICVGMQILFDVSDEFGKYKGLGLIAGNVEKISDKNVLGFSQCVPHIGWSALVQPQRKEKISRQKGLFTGLGEDEKFYFVHSYAAVPRASHHRVADTVYGGRRICAAVKHDNLYGTQFHPEKSGSIGLKVLSNFAKI